MELFRQAATIMALGMGLVFVFLFLIILLVKSVARLIQWHEGRSGGGEPRGPEGRLSEAAAAAIAVALHERD